MSFGDPNNPYGQQPQGGQPAYGYPQQAPQGIPAQGGYAYPQQAYPGVPGYPGSPMPMPGGVKGARVILWILGILQALGGVAVIVIGAVFASEFTDSGSSSSYSSSDAGAALSIFFVVIGIVVVGISLWPILTAAKLAKGRGGVRVSGIIFGSLQTFFAVASLIINIVTLNGMHESGGAPLLISTIPALVSLGLGLWILIGLANSAAGEYFRRPQY
ncbi:MULTISPECIES: hypothetical protein [unclassified Streptomyces]|uniref:hypothetical protein n=1 Tax=unclassified Streptomyces TaxID=2593676 RepID=UPI002030770E|nr:MULTISPECIES: hypothetical protein [unclassified Streptomyces]MCM1970399.1 hypothetical protein [Streptomyces sp. G1]MCX5123023.1 hypothetical protein [Streptomyces sp. NBC_00347]MCX5296365.1 hypothetical protein [Streptomyces sp. NBC_00193]